MKKIKFRYASLLDIKELVNININGKEKFRKIDQKMFKNIIPQKRVLICQEKDEIVGLIYYQKDFLGRTDKYYIEQITVKKQYRKKGYGLLLLNRFLNKCEKLKIKKVFGDIHNDNLASLQMCLKARALISGTLEGFENTNKRDGKIFIRFELN